MRNHEILREAARLAEEGEPFVLATVVAREPPSSARAGARALIRADGTLQGWLGGSCIEPTVRREARRALADGEPRLVVFAPDGKADRPRAVVHPMTCHSGGTVEVYVEPQLPAPVLLLFGDSPVTRALATMGPAAGYRVRTVGAEARPASDAAGGPTFAVVATMGEWDERAAREALESGAAYVGLVASPRRAAELRRRLEEEGAEPGGRLVSPAGLDLGAREPGEIAVTILAEIVERRAARVGRDREEPDRGAPDPPPGGDAAPGEAVDPVCGMSVATAGEHPTVEHEGVVYHFCCEGCRSRFREEPSRFRAADRHR